MFRSDVPSALISRAPQAGRPATALGRLALLAAAVALPLGLVVAPPDALQGQSQRLMYVHVPAAWTAYACFAAVLVAGVAYLVRRDLRWDRWAQAAAEVGVVMTALTLVLGSLWGRVTWGVWWTWDARVLSTVALLAVYLGYLASRRLGHDPRSVAGRSAVIGAAAFALVPVVHFSVVWWRTLHQPPTVLAPSTSPPIDASMLVALLAALAAFTLGAAWVVSRRVRSLAGSTAATTPPPVPAQSAPAQVVGPAATAAAASPLERR